MCQGEYYETHTDDSRYTGFHYPRISIHELVAVLFQSHDNHHCPVYGRGRVCQSCAVPSGGRRPNFSCRFIIPLRAKCCNSAFPVLRVLDIHREFQDVCTDEEEVVNHIIVPVSIL